MSNIHAVSDLNPVFHLSLCLSFSLSLSIFVLSFCVLPSMQVEKPSVKPSKPKKTTTSHKPLKKAKDKQIASGRAAKKKSAETSNTAKPEDKEKSKEMNNKLAEAKE